MSKHSFSLNRIMSPGMAVSEFITFASSCSAKGIEIRNDLDDPSLLGGEHPESLQKLAEEKGVSILTVNALQRFNDTALFEEKKKELISLMEEAASVGCRKIVLCPVNDPEDRRSEIQQHSDLIKALETYAPLFDKYGMIGLVEPLGFSICSVRYKKQAARAIRECGCRQVYQIVHDTFHHYLSGEKEIFPLLTGLVHISGVHPGKADADISDDDRVFVDSQDIMDNKSQIDELIRQGCRADFSFEPFSPLVQKMKAPELKAEIEQSVQFIFD